MRAVTLGIFRAASFYGALTCAAACLSPAAGEVDVDDIWQYYGERRLEPGAGTCRRALCERYCKNDYCAHGQGHLSTEGSWEYDGEFVDGRMEGFGRYENDFYSYEGDFKRGLFDGEGKLTCIVGGKYDGTFRAGRVLGHFRIQGSSVTVETRIKPGDEVGWTGPCN